MQKFRFRCANFAIPGGGRFRRRRGSQADLVGSGRRRGRYACSTRSSDTDKHSRSRSARRGVRSREDFSRRISVRCNVTQRKRVYPCFPADARSVIEIEILNVSSSSGVRIDFPVIFSEGDAPREEKKREEKRKEKSHRVSHISLIIFYCRASRNTIGLLLREIILELQHPSVRPHVRLSVSPCVREHYETRILINVVTDDVIANDIWLAAKINIVNNLSSIPSHVEAYANLPPPPPPRRGDSPAFAGAKIVIHSEAETHARKLGTGSLRFSHGKHYLCTCELRYFVHSHGVCSASSGFLPVSSRGCISEQERSAQAST